MSRASMITRTALTMTAGSAVLFAPMAAHADTGHAAFTKKAAAHQSAARGWACRNVYVSRKGAWGSARVCWRGYQKKGWYEVSVRGTLKDTAGDSRRAAMVAYGWGLHGAWKQKQEDIIGTAKKYKQVVYPVWSDKPVKDIKIKVCTVNRFGQYHNNNCSKSG